MINSPLHWPVTNKLKMLNIFIVTRPVQTPTPWSPRALAIDFLGRKLNADSAIQVVQLVLTARLPSASFLQQVLLPPRSGLSLPEYGVRKSDSSWTLVLMSPSYLQTAIELYLPSLGRLWSLSSGFRCQWPSTMCLRYLSGPNWGRH